MEDIRVIQTALKNLKVGGVTTIVKKTGAEIAVVSGTYATGEVLGTTSPIKCEVVRGKGVGSGILQSVIIKDLSAQNGILDVVIFDSNPTATTFTDNAALDVADADIDKIIGVVSIVAADYASFADNSVATKTGIGLPLLALTNDAVYIALVSRDAKTYVNNELSISLGILQD